MAKKKRNRPVETINNEVQPTNSHNENESIIVKYIKKIFKWQTIVGIATILTLAFVVWDHINHKTEIELIKEEISAKIAEIKNTTSPDKIVITNDSDEELKIIKSFQILALEFCSEYESIESSISLKEYKNMPMPLSSLLDNYIDRLKHMNSLCLQMVIEASKLKELSQYNEINDLELVDATKISDAEASLIKKDNYLDVIIASLEENARKRDLDKCLDLFEDLHSSEICLMADNSCLSLIIDVNNRLNIRIQNKKLQTTN